MPRLLPAPAAGPGQASGFLAGDLARYYAFPAEFDGSGTTIAIVSLYGGARRSDLETYFAHAGMPVPEIEFVSVDGERNNPVASPELNPELALSLEVLGSVAPGARLVVYQAPNHEAGLIDGLSAAITDRERRPDVICLTWLIDESALNPMVAATIHDLVLMACATGVTICAPAGSWENGVLVPTAPGSHPDVLSCAASQAANVGLGLIELPMAPPADPAVSMLWPMSGQQAALLGSRAAGSMAAGSRAAGGRGSGGSISGARASGSAAGGRAVPDVCALAGGQIGYRCFVNGAWVSLIAPGAAACIWAGLLARMCQGLGRPWGMVTDLYAYPALSAALRGAPRPGDADSGDKGPHDWDSGIGWGSPDGDKLLAALRQPGERR